MAANEAAYKIAQLDVERARRDLDATQIRAPVAGRVGRLSFTVDQGQHTQRYQGVVPLEGATLADCAHTYFRQSEQLPTGIKIAARRSVEDGAGHWRAAALMVQQMPEFDAGRIDVDHEQREDDWRKAVILMASATDAEMLDPKLASAQLLLRLFHAEKPRVFERRREQEAVAT